MALVVIAAGLLAGCGSKPEKLGLAGEWVSTGDMELTLVIGPAEDGKYLVSFSGGGIERELLATQESDTKYEGKGTKGEKDTWVFNMIGDNLMNVTVIPEEGKSATTSFKRK